MTNPDEATRARQLSQYLMSESYTQNVDNVVIFEFFDLLADTNGVNANMLKREYCPWFFQDSHPNKKANMVIAPLFVKCILGAI